MTHCPSCQRGSLPEESRFCLGCGSPLSEPASGTGEPPAYTPEHLRRGVLETRTAREGERKEVTVLFVDVAGSLAIAEHLDPEDTHAIMEGLFEISLEAVHAYGGTINQFRGDGFMALFGAPLSHGDDAVRASRAALRIRQEGATYARQVRESFGIPLPLRMGVHTGAVWVGSIGNDLRRDYTAEGPTVGLAARLQEAAQPGQVLISATTAERAGPFLTTTRLGRRPVRGLTEPVEVFELTGRGDFEERFEVEQVRGLTPFVGRERDLARVATLAATDRRAPVRLVQVRGEPGIGKSRLVHEFLARRSGSGTVLRGACRAAGVVQAYQPWLEALRSCDPGSPESEEARSLAETFDGDASTVTGTPEALADSMLALLRSFTQRCGLVLVIEDVQWIDPSSARVLEGILASESEGGAVIVATGRNEPDAVAGCGMAHHRIELGPLEPAECEQIARTILRGFPDCEQLAPVVVARSGGNPLFAEEVARAIRDGGSEMRRAARLEGELLSSPHRLPPTLGGVAAARIDALPDRTKRLLQAASVVGTPFDDALLGRLASEDGDRLADVSDGIADLVGRGLLCRDAAGALDFRHSLLREAAYEQLLLSRRRALHQRCAEELETHPLARTPAGASRIGWHFDQAGREATAAAYLATAGRGYLRLHASAEAAVHLQRSWQLCQEDASTSTDTRVTVGLALASALNGLDRASEAATVLAALRHENLGSQHRGRLARAYMEEGWVRFSERNELQQGQELIEQGLALLEAQPRRPPAVAIAYSYLSRIAELDARIPTSVTYADRLIRTARRRRDPFLEAQGLAFKASALCHIGDLAAAYTAARGSVDVAEGTRNDFALGVAHAFLSKCLVFLRRPDDALGAADRALEFATRSRQVGVLHNGKAWKGYALLLISEPGRAMREFDDLVEINPSWPIVRAHRARGLLALGRYDEACEAAHECLATKPPQLVRVRAMGTLGRAFALSALDDADAGRDLMLETVHVCRTLGLRPHLADALLALAEIARDRGDASQASGYAREAAAVLSACGLDPSAKLTMRPL